MNLDFGKYIGEFLKPCVFHLNDDSNKQEISVYNRSGIKYVVSRRCEIFPAHARMLRRTQIVHPFLEWLSVEVTNL
jgi:hypothetical protein